VLVYALDVVIVWILIAVVVLLVFWLILLYNRMVRLRNEANTGWSNIDVQLKRRNDLIPNLVETVKGYASHERGTFDEVTQARAAVQQAQTPAATAQASDMLTGALGKLFAVAEAYPDLKANQNFLQLQATLSDTEDKISAARRYYNSTVMRYNNGIQTFPSVLVAGPFGFHQKELFEVENAAEREVPQVSFAAPSGPAAAPPSSPPS
jgi:LemA protein